MTEEHRIHWREDFPIGQEEDQYVTRREFTRFLALASGAVLIGNGYFVLRRKQQSEQAAEPVEIAGAASLQPGRALLFYYPTPSDPALLIRLQSGQYVAYRQRCTHLSCPVLYSEERNRLECPCHNGMFDAATGQVLAGPPPRPLPRIALHVEEGRVLATGVIGS